MYLKDLVKMYEPKTEKITFMTGELECSKSSFEIDSELKDIAFKCYDWIEVENIDFLHGIITLGTKETHKEAINYINKELKSLGYDEEVVEKLN